MRHDKAALILDLARRLAASSEGLSLDDMARDLAVSRRTAERMRDAVLMMFPAVEEVSDPPHKRWRIRGGLSAFEQAPTAAELVELAKAASGLRLSGEPGRAAAREGLERKIKSAMRSTTLNRLAELTPIRHAVLAERPLGFVYSRPGAPSRRRIVTPCGLMFGRANYLVAADRDSGRIQTFRLDRMSAITVEEGTARPPQGFDLQAFASRSFGIYQDEVENVELRVLPEGADEARAWRWHPTQTLEDLPDGSVRVRFTASGMRELAWHLFTWGHQVRIIAPDRLKTAMAEALEAAKAALG